MKQKELLLSLFFLFLFNTTAFSQIGINVDVPTEMLDVNGKAKFRDLKTLNPNSNFSVLVTDESNVVKKISKTDLEIKKETLVVTIPDGQTMVIENTLKFNILNIVITAKNTCDRTMINTFSSNYGALAYLNGIARDIVAKVSVIKIPPDSGLGSSATFKLEYPGLQPCSTNGLTPSYFPFTFQKISEYKYNLTNNGGIAVEYTITFQKIY